MIQRQYIINRKLNILVLGRTLGNISEACGNGLTEDPLPASYDISGIQGGTTYHWKVVATDSYGLSTESSVWSFTTQ